MSPLFYDVSVIQNDDVIGIAYRPQLMGDDDDSPALYQGIDGALYLHLILRVERGGRLIQQNNRCIF